MKIVMFPGQGSQSKGMGGELFDKYPELTEKADKILGYSIKELCHSDPRRELNKTQFTQPALFVTNALSYLEHLESTGSKPDFVVGHSLGEFNALLAAECFDFEAGLKLVKKRGELMSKATDGGMAAILNASKEEIETILKENDLNNIDLANYNTPSQIVISGSIKEIGKAQSCFQTGKMLYYPLNTSGPFHSRFMNPSKEKFATYLKRFKLNDLTIPVISNVTALPYKNEDVKTHLADQISNTVKWSESVQFLLKKSQEEKADIEFVEMGNGDVLTKLIHTIKQQTPSWKELNEKLEAKESANQSKTQTSLSKSNSNQESTDNVKSVENESAGSETVNNKTTHNKSASKERPQHFIDAENKVLAWNKKHPVGTKVKSLTSDYDSLETRSEAVVLFGHRAAVYMKSYNGYFDLDEIATV